MAAAGLLQLLVRITKSHVLRDAPVDLRLTVQVGMQAARSACSARSSCVSLLAASRVASQAFLQPRTYATGGMSFCCLLRALPSVTPGDLRWQVGVAS